MQSTDGIAWSSLNASQRKALKPLEAEWGQLDAPSQTKWLTLANRFPKMSPAQQARIQTRMDEWARLTPRERGQARMNYREAQQVPAQERRARWEAYKALPPEQRKQLAARAAPAPQRKSPATDASAESARGKSNLVPNSSYAPKPKAITPTVAQARPGVTTNLITKRPHPPAHQQAGLPKIAVSSGFVDQSTLLPKRGPQGAAARPSPPVQAPAPTSRP
ncbi:MAG: DUF3106 domain-containing protein [Rhizobacter sp.]|nr:DUF3106 domain-containing protein [Rhizobacter sp.]